MIKCYISTCYSFAAPLKIRDINFKSLRRLLRSTVYIFLSPCNANCNLKKAPANPLEDITGREKYRIGGSAKHGTRATLIAALIARGAISS